MLPLNTARIWISLFNSSNLKLLVHVKLKVTYINQIGFTSGATKMRTLLLGTCTAKFLKQQSGSFELSSWLCFIFLVWAQLVVAFWISILLSMTMVPPGMCHLHMWSACRCYTLKQNKTKQQLFSKLQNSFTALSDHMAHPGVRHRHSCPGDQHTVWSCGVPPGERERDPEMRTVVYSEFYRMDNSKRLTWPGQVVQDLLQFSCIYFWILEQEQRDRRTSSLWEAH